jgi:hypothetical protein
MTNFSIAAARVTSGHGESLEARCPVAVVPLPHSPGAGDLPNVEKPAEAANLVLAFAKGLARP